MANDTIQTTTSSLRSAADKLFEEIFSDTNDPDFADYRFFLKAQIDPQWNGTSRPSLIFDGETTKTTRTFPWLASYNPRPGDVVLVVRVSHGWVILGKISNLNV